MRVRLAIGGKGQRHQSPRPDNTCRVPEREELIDSRADLADRHIRVIRLWYDCAYFGVGRCVAINVFDLAVFQRVAHVDLEFLHVSMFNINRLDCLLNSIFLRNACSGLLCAPTILVECFELDTVSVAPT
ncbi:hypothetical protein KC333_g198 [Hortaea werneckii]|nr:hypothetical protein KC333_g198 [Hortaea werneckii]